MSLPELFDVPITLAFIYFFIYSIIGWSMETTYCSIQEKAFVKRGFLLGPYCPIYGCGALLMNFFLSPLAGNMVIFYVTATVMMSGWEYFVGWLLEVTTGVKYWDYSNFKYNLNGRITLVICLWWGLLAYIAVFRVHPAVVNLLARIPPIYQLVLAIVCAAVFFTDMIITIRRLALVTKLYLTMEKLGMELRSRVEIQLEAESAAVDALTLELRERYDELVTMAEEKSRWLRRHYPRMSSKRYSKLLADVQEAGSRVRDKIWHTHTDKNEPKGH